MSEKFFRGKRLNNGAWVHGSVVLLDKDHVFIVPQFGQYVPNDLYIEPPYNAKPETAFNIIKNSAVAVQPDTVCQSTGLCDNETGRIIFEGDILDCGDRVVYVKWNKACASWDSQFCRYKGKRISNGINNADWPLRARVIGNIYDTPELMDHDLDVWVD